MTSFRSNRETRHSSERIDSGLTASKGFRMKTCWHRKFLRVLLSAALLYTGMQSLGECADEAVNFDGQLDAMEDTSGSIHIDSIGANFRVRHYVGNGQTGYQDQSTSLELMLPQWHGSDFLTYVDGRLSITNDGTLMGNGGFGVRKIGPWGRFMGVSMWYDVDGRSAYKNYQQLGIGLEWWGEDWDISSNVYVPVFGRRTAVSDPVFSDPVFSADRIIFNSTTREQVAMDGMDVEAGFRLPFLNEHNLRLYAGFYYFEAADIDPIAGFRSRLEGNLTRDFGGQVIVQNDDVNGTTVGFSLVWNFPMGRFTTENPVYSRTLQDRMEQPFQRQYEIVVAEQDVVRNLVATNPTTGLPYNVLHVNSAAAPGGSGNFEDPINSLAIASTAADSGDLIFVHADSVFNGESFVMKASQILLGEGIDHYIDTVERGPMLVPQATAGTNVPEILNSIGSGIVLADDTRVSGFTITDPALSGIYGANIFGTVEVDRVTVSGSNVSLSNMWGAVDFTDVDILNSTTTGISLSGQMTDFEFLNGSITGSTGAAVNIVSTEGNIQFDGTTIQQNGGTVINVFDAQNGTIDFGTSTIANDSGNGIRVEDSGVDLSFDNPNITNAVGDAIRLTNNTGTYTLSNLALTTNGSRGLVANNSGTVNVTGSSSITANGEAAVDINDTTIAMTFDSLTSNNSTSEGIVIDSSTGTFAVTGNTNISQSELNSIEITNSTTANGLTADFATVNITGAGVGGGNVGHGVFLDNNANSAFTFDTLNVTTDNGGGLVASNSTDVTVNGGVINTTGGPAVSVFTSPALDATLIDLTFATLASTDSSSTGVNLDRIEGDFEVTGSTIIANPALAGINLVNIPDNSQSLGTQIIDRKSNVTFQNVTITDANAEGINIDNSAGNFTFGTVTYQTPTLGNTDPAISMTNSDADTVIAAANITDSLGDGIFLGNNSADASFTTNGGTILNSAGAGVHVDGGEATIVIESNITNSVDRAVIVENTTDGPITFRNGTISDNGGEGILISNADNQVRFLGPVQLTGGDRGVDILGGTGNFLFLNASITDTNVTGFRADGGSATVEYRGNILQTVNATAIEISNTEVGSNISFTTGTTTATNGDGIQITDADGTVNFLGQVTLNGGDAGVDILGDSDGTFNFNNTSIVDPTGTAFNVDGGNPEVNFQGTISQANNAPVISIANTEPASAGHTIEFNNGTISATNGTGIQFGDADGTVDFLGQVTLNGGDAGIDIINDSDGVFTFASAAIVDPTGPAVNIDTGSPTLIYGGNITNVTSTAPVVSITNTDAGGASFENGTVSAIGGGGIFISNSGTTATFEEAVLTNTAAPALASVHISNSSGNVHFSDITINNSGSPGIEGILATNNSGVISSTAGTITTNSATAVEITHASDYTPLAMVLESVNASGAFTSGIIIDSAVGSFTVLPSVTNPTAGSGGTINGATGNAIDLTDVTGFEANFINILNSGGNGINVVNNITSSLITTTTFTLRGNAINNTTGNGISFSQNGTGPDPITATVLLEGGNTIATAGGDGMIFSFGGDQTANVKLYGSTISSVNEGIDLVATGGEDSFVNLLINGNNATTTGPGIHLHSGNNAMLNATVTSNNPLISAGVDAFLAATDDSTGILQLTLGDPVDPGNLGNTINNTYRLDNTASGLFNLGGQPTITTAIQTTIEQFGNTSTISGPPNNTPVVNNTGVISVIDYTTIPVPP